MEIFAIVLFVVAAIFIVQSVKVVPQQNAWVVERLGQVPRHPRAGAEHHRALHRPRRLPALAEGSAARRAEQVCITKDNTQLSVDGIIYFQVTDPGCASYGTLELRVRHHAACADHAAQR